MGNMIPGQAGPAYRPDIDGLRAIAILSVVSFHVSPRTLPGGFTGVDVFFVISGYLISTIVFGNLERGGFSMAGFYARRIRRILPALLTVMLASLAVGWFVLLLDEFAQLGRHVVASSLFLQNFQLWSESGYFDRAAEAKPLLHLWSLAVEEQFYLFWPLLLVACWKRGWNLLAVTAVVFVSYRGAGFCLTHADAVAAFYSPLSRFWELMIGSMLAYWTARRPASSDRGAEPRSFAGLLMLALSFLLIDKERDFLAGWALLPTLGTALLISAGPSAWLNRRVLASRPMVWVGLISYPLYLWHWPMLSFVRIVDGNPEPVIEIAVVVLAFVLAWATYAWIEQPIRLGVKSGVVTLLGTSLLLLAGGVFVHGGFLQSRQTVDSTILGAIGDWDYPQGMNRLPAAAGKSHEIGARGGGITLFVGDSHVQQYSVRVVDQLSRSPGHFNTVRFMTEGGCPPIPGIFEDHPRRRGCDSARRLALDAATDVNVKKLVIGACWNCYFIGIPDAAGKQKYDYYYQDASHGRLPLLDPRGRDAAMERLRSTLVELSRGRTVYLLLDNPLAQAFDPRTYISGNRLSGVSTQALPRRVLVDPRQEELRRRLIEIAAQAGVAVIDPVPTLCDASGCIASTAEGTPVHRDSQHLRPFFVRSFADYLDPALVADD